MTSPGQASRPVLEIAHKSDPGRDPSKQVNEDAYAYRELRLGHLLVVCDGMGGHKAGREASNLAVQTILAMVEGAPTGLSPSQVLKSAIEQAGRAVFQLGGAATQMGRPGSTVVALLVHPGGTDIAHVGDSRAYCIRGTQIYPLTRDHSMVQQMIDAGFLSPDEAYGHPDANKITRALGLRAETDVDLRAEPLPQEARDIFLLGTDGLFDVMRPEEALEVVLGARDLREACDKLVDLANARGGPDNITVMLSRVLEPGLRVPLPSTGNGATQIGDFGAHPLANLEAPPRATLLQAPVPDDRHAAGSPTLKETLPLGTLTTALTGANTTLLDGMPPGARTPSPGPMQIDRGSLEEDARLSQRGGLYLALGIVAVWLIIGAVSLWWLLGRKPSVAVPVDPAPAETQAEAVAPPVPEAVPEIVPEPANPDVKPGKPHSHPSWWQRGAQPKAPKDPASAPDPAPSTPPSAPPP